MIHVNQTILLNIFDRYILEIDRNYSEGDEPLEHAFPFAKGSRYNYYC